MQATLNPQPILSTERLILRRPEMTDAADIQRLAGDYLVAKTTLNMPYPYEDGMAEAFVEHCHETLAAGTGYTFAIELAETNTYMGMIGISPVQQHKHAEMGYWIGVPHWNKGYVTEAARRVMQFGFDDLGLNRIYAQHFTNNPASGRVMQKISMTYEGTLRQHFLRWDEYIDLAMYSILRSEYDAQR